MVRKEIPDRLISIWAVQDALLQSYRLIYLASISILYVFASVLLAFEPYEEISGVSTGMLGLLIGMFGLYIIVQWKRVTDKRGNCVTFIQNQLMYYEMGQIVTIALNQRDNRLKPDIIHIDGDNDIPVVTTFKNFENMSAKKQKEILDLFAVGEEVLYSKETHDIGTRVTLQRDLTVFWLVLWLILIVLFFVK